MTEDNRNEIINKETDARFSDRYSRQERFYGIGKEGQKKLKDSHVVIVGLGALGSVIAEHLTRAGVGTIRLLDRDFVEASNLQRQFIYTEEDAKNRVLKAEAAYRYLHDVNSEIQLIPAVDDLRPDTVNELLGDVDLVIDATDNMETRFLINEYCVEHGIPWIYGGAIQAQGMTMNIVPDGPCLTCLTGQTGSDSEHPQATCASAGVIAPATAVTASIESAEAIKLLIGSGEAAYGLLSFDLWKNRFHRLGIKKDPDCPICGRHAYRYLGRPTGSGGMVLCGRDSVQIMPETKRNMDFDTLAQTLSAYGKVTTSRFRLDFEGNDASFCLFKDGRAIIRNTDSIAKAKAVYAEYIGM